jgi:hypothetical protein
MKKVLFLCLILVTISFAFAEPPSYTNEQSQVSTNGQRTLGGSSTQQETGMTITADSSFELAKIKVYLQRIGSPTFDFTLKVYSVDGSDLPYTLLETSNITLSSGSIATSVTGYDFTFPNGIDLVSGTNYAFVFEADGFNDGSNRVVWDKNADAGNTFFYYSGSAWVDTGNDETFRYYMYSCSNCYTPISQNFTVTGTGLTQLNLTLENGTVYTNTTGNIIFTEIPNNSTDTFNFTLSSPNYFNKSYENYNVSTDLVTGLASYPIINVQDTWSSTPISGFNITIDSVKYEAIGTNLFIPFNETKEALIEKQNYYANFTNISFTQDANITSYVPQTDIKFNASQLYTNNSVPANITIGGVTKANDESFYLSAGTYNVSFASAGYYGVTEELTFSALDNYTYTFTDVSTSLLNITASEYLTGLTVTAFNASITSQTYGFTLTGECSTYCEFGVLADNYTVLITSPIHFTNTSTFEATSGSNVYDVVLRSNRKLFLDFYDEEELTPVTNVNITITNTDYGDVRENINSLNISGLNIGNYEIRYSKDNYTTRSYFINIPVRTETEIEATLYLLKEDSATTFVATVTDKNNLAFAGLTGSLLRRYVEGGQTVYKIVEQFAPSVALGGSAPFTAVANNVPYLFRITDSDGTVLFQGSGQTANSLETLYLIDQQIFIKVNRGVGTFQTFQDLTGIQANFNATNNTDTDNTFWLSYDATGIDFNNICIQTYLNGQDLYSNTCTTDSAGVISAIVPVTNGSYYVGYARINLTADDNKYNIGAAVVDYRENNGTFIFGIIGLFLTVLTLIVAAIGFSSRPEIAVVISTLAIVLYASSFLNIIIISLPLQATLFVVGLIVAYLIKD